MLWSFENLITVYNWFLKIISKFELNVILAFWMGWMYYALVSLKDKNASTNFDFSSVHERMDSTQKYIYICLINPNLF